MSKYTMTVKRIVEILDNNENLDIKSKIENARTKIFDFDYPKYSQSMNKQNLETKIIRSYYLSEIGFETVNLWKFELENTLNSIMPKYEYLFKSLLEYDILNTINIKEKEDFINKGIENTENSANIKDILTSSNNQKEQNSGNRKNNISKITQNDDYSRLSEESEDNSQNYDYPNQHIKPNLDYQTDGNLTLFNKKGTNNTVFHGNEDETNIVIDSLTKDILNTLNSTDEKKSKLTNIKNVDFNTVKEIIRKGNNGNFSFPELITQYRNIYINLDNEIVKDLQNLFMLIY